MPRPEPSELLLLIEPPDLWLGNCGVGSSPDIAAIVIAVAAADLGVVGPAATKRASMLLGIRPNDAVGVGLFEAAPADANGDEGPLIPPPMPRDAFALNDRLDDDAGLPEAELARKRVVPLFSPANGRKALASTLLPSPPS